ncbi:hypothetical protein DPPLL_20270 [Desulfofustis limnaeus]|uniref:Glycosyltransferase family 1 protein n=2 Tax=Desulfofustis limnaeus TaxID=2740163 RepID=A0ABN6M886_9BACT|nr:hypothetical protein DPPLL_20270 [Desulfofustis limnaeus]
MRLVLLPVSPVGDGGYNKAVALDIKKLNIDKNDQVIVYNHGNQKVPENFNCIQRPNKFSSERILNTLLLRPSTDLLVSSLANKVSGATFSGIFCGDVMMYKATRKLFPNIEISVRFHNLFSLALKRQKVRRMTRNLKFNFNLFIFSRLESIILNDRKAYPIFINDIEQKFFELMFPGRESSVWSPIVSNQVFPTYPRKPDFVYFGSHAHHQTPGIKKFISEVFQPLKNRWPTINFHLWGRGGAEYHCPSKGILHHGDYNGESIPMAGEGLFINPDLLGGGVKFKVLEWLENGIAFISTPYGVEGYSFKPNRNIIVAEIFDWIKQIESYFKEAKLI